MAAEEGNKISFEYLWPLKFRDIIGNPVQIHIDSPIFCISFSQTSLTFRLQLYPNYGGTVVRAIYIDGPQRKICGDVHLSFLKANTFVASQYATESVDCDLKKGEASFQLKFGHVMDSSYVRNGLGITNDNFGSAIVKVKFVVKIPEPFFGYRPPAPKLTVEKRIGNLLDAVLDMGGNKQYSDVKLRSKDGTTFYCHKVILAQCAPVFFKNMLESGMAESSADVIDFPFLCGNSLAEVLRFVYKNQVIQEKLENYAEEILHAAEMYELDDLKRYCELSLYETVTSKNAIFMIRVGDLFKLKDLKAKAVCVTVENYQDLVNTDEWGEFCVQNPRLINEIILHASERINVNSIRP